MQQSKAEKDTTANNAVNRDEYVKYHSELENEKQHLEKVLDSSSHCIADDLLFAF